MIVVGKNSFVALDALRECEMISHKEVENNSKLANSTVIVFSWSRVLDQNLALADHIISLKPKKIIFISSVTALLKQANAWNYPRSKILLERYYQSQFTNTSIIRVGFYEGSHDFSKLVGHIPKTSRDELRASISDLVDQSFSRKTMNCWHYEHIPFQKRHLIFVTFYKKLFKFSKILARLYDLFIRMMGGKMYGYTLFTVTDLNINDET